MSPTEYAALASAHCSFLLLPRNRPGLSGYDVQRDVGSASFVRRAQLSNALETAPGTTEGVTNDTSPSRRWLFRCSQAQWLFPRSSSSMHKRFPGFTGCCCWLALCSSVWQATPSLCWELPEPSGSGQWQKRSLLGSGACASPPSHSVPLRGSEGRRRLVYAIINT